MKSNIDITAEWFAARNSYNDKKKFIVELDTLIYGKGHRLLGGIVNGTDFYKRKYYDVTEIDHDIYDFLNMLDLIYGKIDVIACESVRFLPGYLKFQNEHPNYNFIKRRAWMANKIENFMYKELKRIKEYNQFFLMVHGNGVVL